MAQIGARISRLEQSRPAQRAGLLDMSQLDQATLDAMAQAYADALTAPAPDWTDATLSGLVDRIERMQAQGLAINDLSDRDLELIVAAGDAARGQA
jgi:hypothetical protein